MVLAQTLMYDFVVFSGCQSRLSTADSPKGGDRECCSLFVRYLPVDELQFQIVYVTAALRDVGCFESLNPCDDDDAKSSIYE